MGFLLPFKDACMKPPFDIAADLDTPVSAYLKLAPFRPRFLLESVEGGERLARYSFIGFGDCLEVKIDAAGVNVGGAHAPRPKNKQELLVALQEEWEKLRVSSNLKALIKSMPKRVKMVFEADGMLIKGVR